MNYHCENPCKYVERCRLDEEQTKGCKAKGYQSDLICGLTFEQIDKMQQSPARKK